MCDAPRWLAIWVALAPFAGMIIGSCAALWWAGYDFWGAGR